MIITAKHRSQALADRHLARLRRQFREPRYTVEQIARRNAKGHYSERGHYFTFEVTDHGENEEEPEYGGAVDSP